MLDPRIEKIRDQYNLAKDDFWELPQKKGTYCVKHSALESVAAQAGVNFDMPVVLEADSANGLASVVVRGTLGERSLWSIGECSPKNNRNSYPWAMAEKRAVDRVILKLVGLHGLVYSEEESDSFKENPPAPPVKDESYSPPPRKANGLPEVGWREDGSRTSFWLKTNGTAAELKAQLLEDAVDCHSLVQLEKLKEFYRGKARELKFNRQFMDVLKEEFDAIERAIMNSMEAAELAEIPLEKALKNSVLLAG